MNDQPEEPPRLKQLQAEIRYLVAAAEDHRRRLRELEHKLAEYEVRLNLTSKES